MTPTLHDLQGPGVPLARPDEHPATRLPTYMIATGLECSTPTVQGGRRRDQLAETGHYQRWREDLALCREIGTRWVRYGIPYYRTHLAPGRYDWSFADEVLPEMWNLGLLPIVDLCHFGVPDWVGGFQDPDWPVLFAEYASAFAQRYPWIKFYTPVNEMLVCARFSAREGMWNEQQRSERAFLRSHANQCRATLLAIESILRQRPDAIFIQSEIAEVCVELSPDAEPIARFHDQMRFLTFDHLYGRAPDGEVMRHLLDHGLQDDELRWFLQHGRRAAPHCIMGMDYYATNERVVRRDGTRPREGQMLGWHAIARDYYARYQRPMMLTETNADDLGQGESRTWLQQLWSQALHLRTSGVPMIGFTWFSLTDQVDWDIRLVEIRGRVTPNGLCRLDRTLRPVGELYRTIAHDNAWETLIHGVPTGLLTH